MHFSILVTSSHFDQIRDQVLLSYFFLKLTFTAKRHKSLLFTVIRKSQHIVSDYAVLRVSCILTQLELSFRFGQCPGKAQQP